MTTVLMPPTSSSSRQGGSSPRARSPRTCARLPGRVVEKVTSSSRPLSHDKVVRLDPRRELHGPAPGRSTSRTA